MSPKFIIGNKFIDALMEAGVIDKDTTRVVIDAKAGDAVMLYTARIGDDRLTAMIEDGGIVVTEDPVEARV